VTEARALFSYPKPSSPLQAARSFTKTQVVEALEEAITGGQACEVEVCPLLPKVDSPCQCTLCARPRPTQRLNAIPTLYNCPLCSFLSPIVEGKEELARVNNRALRRLKAERCSKLEVSLTLGDTVTEQERLGLVTNATGRDLNELQAATTWKAYDDDGKLDRFVSNGSISADGKKLAESFREFPWLRCRLERRAAKSSDNNLMNTSPKVSRQTLNGPRSTDLARRQSLSESNDRSDKTPASAALPSQAMATVE
jgi:hypothetical protein